MKVITLTPEEFDRHTTRLAEMVKSVHPEPFNIITGIKTGGTYVCDSFLRAYDDKTAFRMDLSLRRPSTKRKSNIIFKALRLLPLWTLNLLRKGEAMMLGHRRHNVTSFELPADYVALLQQPCPEVLVMDDAVDSGVTLASICESIIQANPNVKITTAALTVTTPNPILRPDVTIYDDSTLIRFPWSKDYKQ